MAALEQLEIHSRVRIGSQGSNMSTNRGELLVLPGPLDKRIGRPYYFLEHPTS
jgi:hypothetical protein